MNPCIPGTYNFLEIVVGEIAAMHHSINKELHNHFHIGGDEMNTKNWESSPACTKYLADNKMDWKDLPVHFFQKYMKIVTKHNFHIDGWEEVWEYERTGYI